MKNPGSAPPPFEPIQAVEDIKKLILDPLDLTSAQRRNCVEVMRYSANLDVAKIARYLKVSPGTVHHDLAKIHRAWAQRDTDGDVQEKVTGELLAKIDAQYQLACQDKNPAAALKAIEMKKALYQDLDRFKKSEQIVRLEGDGLSILKLAQVAAERLAKRQALELAETTVEVREGS